MQMWLSYIIPLYNCGSYISACLDSILRQGLSPDEYEVIVVDDGSDDNGPGIVARYCADNANFRMIRKSNGGVSSARNVGIDEARGQYLFFMDADDYLVTDGMRVLRDCYIRKCGEADMFAFCSRTVDRYYSTDKYECIPPHRLLFEGSFLEFGNGFGIKYSIWTQLFSRRLLLSLGVRFLPYTIAEDSLFMLSVFEKVDARVVATDLNIYRYTVREDSAMMGVVRREHIESVFHDLMALYAATSAMAENSLYDSRIFRQRNDNFRRWAFTRLCSGNFSLDKIRTMLAEARSVGFYPAVGTDIPLLKFINRIVAAPWMVWLFAKGYRNIFLRFVKPWVGRN